MRLDLIIRLVPLTLAPLVFAWLTGTPLSTLGLALRHPLRDLLIGIPLALGGFLVATAFAEYLARRNRRWFVPDERDLLVQSVYYIGLNAPIEEWFFRGFLQGSLVRWWHVPAVAVLAATAIFGGYHLLDRWGWRPVVGATFAGLVLGVIYLWQPQPASLLAPILVHAAITCGFLSLGPYLVFRWRLTTRRVGQAVAEPVRE